MTGFCSTVNRAMAAPWAQILSPDCAQTQWIYPSPRSTFSAVATPAFYLSATSESKLHPITCKAGSAASGGNPFASLKGAISTPSPSPTHQFAADYSAEDVSDITENAAEAEANARKKPSGRGKSKEVDLGGFELKLAAGGGSLKRERGGEERGRGKGKAVPSSADGRQRSSSSGGGSSSGGSGAVRVYATRRGKAGKTVTVIEGLGRRGVSEEELSGVVKALKTALGSGGTLKEGLVEIQGDVVQRVVDYLSKKGHKVQGGGR